MNAHRFILQPYKGVATRHTCPACHMVAVSKWQISKASLFLAVLLFTIFNLIVYENTTSYGQPYSSSD